MSAKNIKPETICVVRVARFRYSSLVKNRNVSEWQKCKMQKVERKNCECLINKAVKSSVY